MKKTKVAYCTGFWCTNIGNAFFSMGVEYALKKILGEENVTVVSDYQTYTNSIGKRLYKHKNQFDYIKNLDVDYVVLAGPVISKYFLYLWKDTIVELNKRGIGYILLSTGIMKLDEESKKECLDFFKEYPPYIMCSRDLETYNLLKDYATNSYNGICFSMFVSDYYHPCKIKSDAENITINFDKLKEPIIVENDNVNNNNKKFTFNGKDYEIKYSGLLNKIATKTDRYTDALIYVLSLFPSKKINEKIGEYSVIRTDHRFHPHFRTKIYNQKDSFCADLPYGYLNIYANSALTLSDRVHACAVTMALGNSSMLFSKTNRSGLLDRVGATTVCEKPTKIDLKALKVEKDNMLDWIGKTLDNAGDRNESSN